MALKDFNLTIAAPQTQAHLMDVLAERKNEFVANVTALVANNKMLQNCQPLTVMYAALKATTLGLPLDPSLGQAYVVPYGQQAQFQVG